MGGCRTTVPVVLQPVGPLPPEVYWRRRVAAVVGLLVVLAVLIWIGSAVAGGSPSPTGSAAAESSSTAATTASSAAPTSTPPAPVTGAPTSTVVPVPGSSTPAPAGTAAPASATPPAPCPDPSVALTAQVAQPSYKVGEEPVFRLLVSNSSTTPCTRALDAGLQQVIVYSADGSQRLWSSNDCYPGTGTETKTLNPGEQTAYSIRWSGTTSQPGCTAPRTPVAAGAYTVAVSLGAINSVPVPFTLT